MKDKFISKIGRFSFNVVPGNTKTEETQDGIKFICGKKWDFYSMKKALTSIKGVIQDISSKPWTDFDDECYYSCTSGDEKILFEINSGRSNDNVDCSTITIKFSKGVPSMKIFEMFIGLLKELNLPNFKVFSFIDNKFLSLSELKEINKRLK